jgi:mannose-6-phosphate isomerase-like protein (cupin superfamily)
VPQRARLFGFAVLMWALWQLAGAIGALRMLLVLSCGPNSDDPSARADRGRRVRAVSAQRLLAARPRSIAKEVAMTALRLSVFAVLAAAAIFTAPVLAQSNTLPNLPPTVTPADKSLKWATCPEGLPKGCQLAVINGDPAKGGVDAFLKLPAKSKVESHKHTSAERIVALEGEVTVAYGGHKPVTLRRGTYHFIPAEAVHAAVCVSAQPCVLFISFEKPLDLILAPMDATPTTTPTARPPKKGGC